MIMLFHKYLKYAIFYNTVYNNIYTVYNNIYIIVCNKYFFLINTDVI